LSDRERYGRFTTAMHAVYVTMERELDAHAEACEHGSDGTAVAGPNGSILVANFWRRFGATLRRAESLRADLADVGVEVDPEQVLGNAAAPLTPATERFV
jgi:hypothetical protein